MTCKLWGLVGLIDLVALQTVDNHAVVFLPMQFNLTVADVVYLSNQCAVHTTGTNAGYNRSLASSLQQRHFLRTQS